SEFLTAHDTDEERDYESQTADNQISLLVSRLCTRYSGLSVVSGPGLSDFVSFVAFCKKSFCAPRASRLRLRQTASSPRRPDEERAPPLYAWLEKTRRPCTAPRRFILLACYRGS